MANITPGIKRASSDTEIHVGFQTGLLLIAGPLIAGEVCKAITASLGYDYSSRVQEDALMLTFGFHLSDFGFQVTSNGWV